MEGIASVVFYDTAPPDRRVVIDDVIAVCTDYEFTGPNDERMPSAFEIKSGPVELHQSNDTGIGAKTLYLTFGDENGQTTPEPFLDLGISAEHLVPDEDEDTESEFLDTFIDMIRELVEELSPEFVTSFNTWVMDGEAGPTPYTVLPESVSRAPDIDRVPWLGVYADPLIEQFGGRERVRNAPAWLVEELDTGAILVVTTRMPWEGYRDEQPVDRYLLEGQDGGIDDESGDLPLSDSFAVLKPGDYGVDACVARDDIAPEFHNEDLQAVRVYIDEEWNLRRVSDDSFVRNIVTDSPDDEMAFIKRMLAEIPPGAADDDLLVSALLHSAIPPEFVRLDDLNGENVVSRVLDLDVETNKIDLLVSLGDAAQHEDGLDPYTIESALDSLADLEDVDGIDRYIEQNLL